MLPCLAAIALPDVSRGCASERSSKDYRYGMLQDAVLPAKIGFDAAENEPSKNWLQFQSLGYSVGFINGRQIFPAESLSAMRQDGAVQTEHRDFDAQQRRSSSSSRDEQGGPRLRC